MAHITDLGKLDLSRDEVKVIGYRPDGECSTGSQDAGGSRGVDQEELRRRVRECRQRRPEEPGPGSGFEQRVSGILDGILRMLLEKNRKYGDSALHPARVFSKASPVEQILVRIDDKLSRVRNEQGDEDEDVIDDLIGYLVLLKLAREDCGLS